MRRARSFGVGLAVVILTGSLASHAPADGISYTSVSRDATSFFRAGIDLLNNLYVESAAEQFERAVELDPQFAMAYLYLARTALPESYSSYREHLDRAISLVDGVSEGEQLVIRAYQARDENRPADEEKYLRRLQAMFPADIEAHYALAEVYFANNDYREAARELEAAIAIDDEYPPAYNLLGYSYAFLGEYDAAISTLSAYANLIPDEPNPHDSMGEVLLMAGRYDESIEKYALALEIDPAFYSAHAGRGHCFLFKDDKKRALEEYEKMAAVAPTEGVRRDAHRWMAIAELYAQNYPEAVTKLRKLQAELIAGRETLLSGNRAIDIAWVLQAAGETDAAVAELQSGWQIIMGSQLPASAKTSYTRRHHVAHGMCLAQNGDVRGAREFAEKIKRLVENSADLDDWQDYNWLTGEILLRDEDYRNAIANLLQGPPDNPRVLYAIGLAHERRGSVDHAKSYFERVRNFNRPGLLYAIARRAAEEQLN